MVRNFLRIIKIAFKDFFRNKGISVATIFVLVIAMLILTSLLFLKGITSYLIEEVNNRMDITAFFKEGTSEEDILKIKEELLKISPNIKKIDYVSKEQAYLNFQERHKNNPILQKALEQVGENPFLPSLNILTVKGDPSEYEEISNILIGPTFGKFLEKVDFFQKKEIITKVHSFVLTINKVGIGLGIILVFISILVVLNTVKLAIENSKEEIVTMKIVGASNWFVRGPFVIEGVIYSLIAFIICILLSWLFAFFMAPKISFVIPGFDLLNYFLTNLKLFVLIQLGFGLIIGVFSSWIAIKKYLEV